MGIPQISPTRRFSANSRNGTTTRKSLRLQNAGSHKIMLIIEGISASSAKEEALLEREVRKLKIERLTKESDYGITELDQLVEEFAQRLEVEWIQKI